MTLFSDAHFSDDRIYRYSLTRIWGSINVNHDRLVAFIGLNPSTADETADDPTIRREIGYAKSWGYDGLIKLNLFAFRATDPMQMKKQQDPIGPANNAIIALIAEQCGLVVATWGAHGTFRDRDRHVVKIIKKDIHCLALTLNGIPKHSLYLKKDLQPQLWRKY